MAIALYMDHHVPRAITEGLRARGVDVITAFEDNAHRLIDPKLLDRAAELKRVLFSQDSDLIAEARKRQLEGAYFFGVIYAHQRGGSIGAYIRELEIVAKAGEASDLANQVAFLLLG